MTRTATTALVCAAVLTAPLPAVAAPAKDDLRREHESCQALRQAGQGAEAGACFERVYVGLTEIEPRASQDLFNVLSDSVKSYQEAHAAGGDPQPICRAAAVLHDYLGRTQKAEAIRLRRRAKQMAERVNEILTAASQTAGRDVCVPVETPKAPAPESEPETTGETAQPATMKPLPELKRLPPRRATVVGGQRAWAAPPEQGIELLAAGFGVSIGGAVASAVGVGLLLYRAECTSETPDCSDAALARYHDAGYLTLAAGAGILLAGATLLFVDRIQERKRRAAMAAPSFGPNGAGIAAVGRF